MVGWRCMQKQGQVQCFRLGVMAGIAGWRVCEGVRWGGGGGSGTERGVLRGFWLYDFVLCQVGFVNSLQTTQWDRHRDIPSPAPKALPSQK